jgi:hypothetical protein
MRLSKADQKKYPRFAYYVRFELSEVTMASTLVNAMEKMGALRKNQLKTALQWDFGPEIRIVPLVGGAPGVFAPDSESDEIRINENVVKDFEAGYGSRVAKQGHAYLVGVMLLHALTRGGDDSGGVDGPSGDIASKGTDGGIASMNVEGPTTVVSPSSLDVRIEGKNVQLLGDQMLNGGGPPGSPANPATMTGPILMTSISDVGDSEKCPRCKISTGKTKSADAKPYDEFFSEAEMAELDKLGQANPDLVAMLPPKGGRFKVLSQRDTRDNRDKYEQKKKKAGMKGEYHHPHPIKVGGCPIHQELVLKPDEEPEKSRVDAVDDQINDVVNRAIARNDIKLLS